EKNFTGREQVTHRSPDDLGVWNRAPLLDAQTQRKNLACDECQMRVLNIAKQKLGPGVDNGCAHGRPHSRRAIPNTQHSNQQSCHVERSVRRFPPNQAAVLSCFLRISGSFLPSTTARLIVTSAISSRLGTSYMMSSMIRSSIERNARAPVPLVTDCAARARKASLVTVNRTPSIQKSLVYCLIIAFFVSVRIATISSSVSASSELTTGKRPINSGIIPNDSKSSGSTCRIACFRAASSTSSVGPP